MNPTPRSARAAAALLWLSLVLGGCGGSAKTARDICDDPREYQESHSVDLLSIPGDLDSPDRSARLEIPDEESAGRYPDGRPCLDKPPDYFGR